MADACGVAEFAQALGFDLANAFARDFELFTNFFERAGVAVHQTEAELKDFPLTFREAAEDILQLALE